VPDRGGIGVINSSYKKSPDVLPEIPGRPGRLRRTLLWWRNTPLKEQEGCDGARV